MNPSQILVAIADQTVFLKLIGRATFNMSPPFKSAIGNLEGRGYRHFVLELTDCAIMDSTFLGLLASWATRRGAASAESQPSRIQLHGANARLQALLADLGIQRLFSFVEFGPTGLDYQTTPEVSATPAVLAQTSLEAHQALMAIHPPNISKFKDVVAFLQEDLNRPTPPGSTPSPSS